MSRKHNYRLELEWTGNQGTGTSGYRNYARSHIIRGENKPEIAGSSDPAFRGDPSKYNPEELLLASLSACHMLWFLHLCAEKGVVVTAYTDSPAGIIIESPDGAGRFKEVILNPKVNLAEALMAYKLEELHHKAHENCFIANSVNFPVGYSWEYTIEKP